MNATIFDVTTGQILRMISCPLTLISKQCQNGEDYIYSHHSDTTFYIVDRVPKYRPEMALNVTGSKIENIPLGCNVKIEGEALIVNDGELELTFDFPGVYPIKFACWPYLDATVEITI
jgi:hypothetical protein